MFHVIINPASRSGRALALWNNVKHCFREAGVPYKVYFSEHQGHIEEICRNLTKDGQDTKIVVFGGDGTVNEAINGIQDFDHVQFGYVPTGSSNDLARGLGLPKDPEAVLRQILKGETVRTVDLGLLHYLDEEASAGAGDLACRDSLCGGSISRSAAAGASRRFIVSAGIGFDAAICQEVAVSPFKKVFNRLHLGKLIYLAVAIRLILTQPMVPARVTLLQKGSGRQDARKNKGVSGCRDVSENRNAAGSIDMQADNDRQERIQEKASPLWKFRHFLFIVCMNHPYEGGGFQFCPQAKGGDGALDVCGAADLNRLMFFHLFPKAYNGGHIGYKGIHIAKGTDLCIRTARPCWVHTDGEVRRKADKIRIEALPGVLQLME